MQAGVKRFGKNGLAALGLIAVLGLVSSPLMASEWSNKSWGDDKSEEKKPSSMGHDKSWSKSEGQDSEGHMTMRMRMIWNLDLSAKQRTKIRKIQRDLRAKVWGIEDRIEDISDEIFNLYQADKRDAKKIGAIYGKIFDLRRQKIEMMINAGNDVEAVLTKQQTGMLKKMRSHRKWGSGWGG